MGRHNAFQLLRRLSYTHKQPPVIAPPAILQGVACSLLLLLFVIGYNEQIRKWSSVSLVKSPCSLSSMNRTVCVCVCVCVCVFEKLTVKTYLNKPLYKETSDKVKKQTIPSNVFITRNCLQSRHRHRMQPSLLFPAVMEVHSAHACRLQMHRGAAEWAPKGRAHWNSTVLRAFKFWIARRRVRKG